MMPQVLLLHIRVTNAGSEAETALFDALVAWGDARALFVGGSHATLVVYAALLPVTALQRKSLKHLLFSRPEVVSYRIEITEPRHLLGAGERTACLEAVSQAQRFLAERTHHCADAVAELALTYVRRWQCRLMADGQCLELQSLAIQLQLLISRLDKMPEPAFGSLAGRSVAFSELQNLVPDWTALHWERVAWGGDHAQSQWSATAAGRHISLAELPGSGLAHQEVMRRLMECICGG